MKRIILALAFVLAMVTIGYGDTRWPPGAGISLGMTASPSGGGISYIYKDGFSTNVAAGAVGDTAAVTGPGYRFVYDTTGKMNVNGGTLNITGRAAAAWGNPSFISIPNNISVKDNFNRSDGALTTPWTNQCGTISISGNKAMGTSFDTPPTWAYDPLAIATITGNYSDVFIGADIYRNNSSTAGDGVGFILRWTDNLNYVDAFVRQTAPDTYVVCIEKVVAGSPSPTNYAITYVAGARLEVMAAGTQFNTYYNGAYLGTATYSDSVLQSGINGLIFIKNDDAIDNFAVYPLSQARTAGRILTASYNPSAKTGKTQIGFKQTALTSGGTGNDFLIYSDGYIYFDDGAVFPKWAAYNNGTTYTLGLLQKSTGAYFLTKDTLWKIRYIGTTDTTATLFPRLNTGDAGDPSAVVDYFNMPTMLWLPTPSISDGFGGTWPTSDGAGHSETSGVGSGGSGKTWTYSAGNTWAINAGHLVNNPGLGSELATGSLTVGQFYYITATQINHFYAGCAIGNTFMATAATALDANNKVKLITFADTTALYNTGTSNVYASVDMNIAAEFHVQGLVLCYVDANNYIIAYHLGRTSATNYVKVDQVLNGTPSNLIQGTITYAAGSKLAVSVDGNTIYLWYKNTLIGTGTKDDSINGTQHGLLMTYSNNGSIDTTYYNDNMFIVPTGNEGQYAVMNTFTLQ